MCDKEVEVNLRNKELCECTYTINQNREVIQEIHNEFIEVVDGEYVCSECGCKLDIE